MIPADPSQCTYSGDPGFSTRDAVRFWCQDTDPNFWILTDWEYDYLIEFVTGNTNNDPVWIASVACNAIAGKFAKETSVSADGVSVDLGSLQRKYMELASSLRDQYDEQHGDMELPTLQLPLSAEGRDMSLPPLLFGIGMSDNFEAGNQDYGWRRLYADRTTGPYEEF